MKKQSPKDKAGHVLQKTLRKFIPSAYTARVAERFLQMDRWKFFKSRRSTIEGMFEIVLAEQFAERLVQIAEFVDLARKPFTMRAFYKICRAKGIKVFRYKRDEKNVYGQYYPGRYIDKRGFWHTGDAIWLRSDLTGRFLVEVAAHEISHFCLHCEIALTTGRLLPYCKELNIAAKKGDQSLMAEIEADLMTAMLLTKKEKLK